MSNTFLTADLHLGHSKVALERGFASVAEHDQWVADTWAATVRPKDTVIVVGDLTLANPANALTLIDSLPGTKDFVTGNHDRCHPANRGARSQQAAYLKSFRSVQQFLVLRHNGKPVMVSHFPYQGDHTEEDRHTAYRLRDEGRWLLHGHVHDLWKQAGRQINVGLDPWGKPVSYHQLTSMMSQEVDL